MMTDSVPGAGPDDGADDFLAALESQENETNPGAVTRPGDDDDDEDAPRMNWPAEEQPADNGEKENNEQQGRKSESVMRRMARRFSVGGTKKKSDDPSRGSSSISRFFGGGVSPKKAEAAGQGQGQGGEDQGPQRRGSSLARFLGADDDGRGPSLTRFVMSEDKEGKLKAFRNMRKLASRTRKGVTGKSSSEAASDKSRKAEELEASLRIQQELVRQDSEGGQGGYGDPQGGQQPKVAPEDRLMAAVGARRREWQMVYSHLYMKGLGMGGLVDKLLKCGITLADYHSLAVEDEDGDSQEMGFEDYDSMVAGEAEGGGDDDEKEKGEDDDGEGEESGEKMSASLEAAAAASKKRSTLDEDLAIDTGCTTAEARKLRHAVMAFYKCEKALGFLKGHALDGALECILMLGLLPDDVRYEALEEDEEVLERLRGKGKLPDSTIAALGKAMIHYDKVQAALNEFDSLNMAEEASFTINLGLPMGLRLDDDTLVVLSVEPGGQAAVAGVPAGSRVLAVGGETVTIVEDAIAALKRLRDAGNLDAVVVYKEFQTTESTAAAAAAAAAGSEKGASASTGSAPPIPPPPPYASTGKGYVAPPASDVLKGQTPNTSASDGQGGGEEQAELPGMSGLSHGEAGDDGGAELPGMAKVRSEEGGAVGAAGAAAAGKKKNARRRSSMGPGGAERRASWAATQSILNVKRLAAHAHTCSEEDMAALVASLTALVDDNASKIKAVGAAADDKLFSSKQICELCEVTPSVKTKQAFLEVLIPRCTDPAEGGGAIVELFRFTEDKSLAAEALKVRASALKAGMQLVASTGGAFAGQGGTQGSAGAAAAAVHIAGVTYSAGGSQGKRGSLGGGYVNQMAVKRDANGMIGNPLLLMTNKDGQKGGAGRMHKL